MKKNPVGKKVKGLLVLICVLTGGLSVLVPDSKKDAEMFIVKSKKNSNVQLASFRKLKGSSSMGAICVMTRNMYDGIDLDMLIRVKDVDEIAFPMARAYDLMIKTKIEERAESLANELLSIRPHLLALQEAVEVHVQSPGDFFQGNPISAEEAMYKYINILFFRFGLLRNMRQGLIPITNLDYFRAAPIKNTEFELPVMTQDDPFAYDDIRITDYDCIHFREDVTLNRMIHKNYDTYFPVDHLGIKIIRGYIAVYAMVDGKEFCFINTQLEPASTPEQLAVQQAQADELLVFVNQQSVPVILAGDFNSSAPNGATYQMIINGGCTDIWTINAINVDPDGFTHGHDPDLRNPEPNFTRRIDHIFLGPGWDTGLLGPVFGYVTGKNPHNKTQSGLWPSDHGGVVAWIFFYKNL